MPFYTLTVRNDFCANICVTRLLHVLLFHLQFNSEHDNIDEKLMMRGFEARESRYICSTIETSYVNCQCGLKNANQEERRTSSKCYLHERKFEMINYQSAILVNAGNKKRDKNLNATRDSVYEEKRPNRKANCERSDLEKTKS
jgi:hypothetical protein